MIRLHTKTFTTVCRIPVKKGENNKEDKFGQPFAGIYIGDDNHYEETRSIRQSGSKYDDIRRASTNNMGNSHVLIQIFMQFDAYLHHKLTYSKIL